MTTVNTNTKDTNKRVRLFFICIPRSGSTSILKCLSFMDDVEAWFEPYISAKIALQEYGHHTGKELPTDWNEGNAEEFDKAAKLVQEINKLPLVEGKKYAFSDVKQSIDNSTSPVVIVKDMANSFKNRVKYLPSFNSGFKYVFIIRHPALAISSYRQASIGAWTKFGKFKDKSVEDFDLHTDDRYYRMSGGCYRNLNVVWRHVHENLDPEPLVIDTEDFMLDPEAFLKKICEVGGFEYHDRLLEWDSSPDIIMSWKNPGGVPAMLKDSLGDFHRTAIYSSCFTKQTKRKETPPLNSLTKDVKRAVKEGLKAYEEIFAHRFQPKTQ